MEQSGLPVLLRKERGHGELAAERFQRARKRQALGTGGGRATSSDSNTCQKILFKAKKRTGGRGTACPEQGTNLFKLLQATGTCATPLRFAPR